MSSKQGEQKRSGWRGWGQYWGCSTLTEGLAKEGVSPQQLSGAVWVTWPGVLLKPSEKRLEAQPLVHVLEANGRNMSGAEQDRAMAAVSLALNGTPALGLQDQEMNSALLGVFYSYISYIAFISLYCHHWVSVFFLSETAVFFLLPRVQSVWHCHHCPGLVYPHHHWPVLHHCLLQPQQVRIRYHRNCKMIHANQKATAAPSNVKLVQCHLLHQAVEESPSLRECCDPRRCAGPRGGQSGEKIDQLP